MIPKTFLKIWLGTVAIMLALVLPMLGWAFVANWCEDHPLNWIWFGPLSLFGITGLFTYIQWRLDS